MTAARRLREDALACFSSAVAAVEPEGLVRSFLAEHPEVAAACGVVRVVGIGKAAAAMARGAAAALGASLDPLERGVLLVPAGQEAEAPPGFAVFGGGHPVPSAAGVAGAAEVLALAQGLGVDDLLVCLISGGGSALMTLPPDGVSLADLQATTESLLRAGATIRELNTVRKHLDRLKGGRLARAAAPARVLALVLSDVVGDPLDVIASGPVSPDPTTFADAVAVLERRSLWPAGVPSPVRSHLERGVRGDAEESPGPGDPAFSRVATHVVGSNRLAAEAAVREAERRGYRTLLLSTLVTGEAREVGAGARGPGRRDAPERQPARPPGLPGRRRRDHGHRHRHRARRPQPGGRARRRARPGRSALHGTAPAEERILVLAAGTDGIDGPTDAAGALAIATTVRRAREAGLDPARALAANDAYPFFDALGDLVVTGATGTNVMDLVLVLVAG